MSRSSTILLTGATGHIGGRLLCRLEARERTVRCLVRRAVAPGGKGRTTSWVVGDVLAPSSLERAMAGVGLAYYLVHSMDGGADFADVDRRAAHNFGAAARRAGLRQIVYLGGLGRDPELSTHLASRQEVGRILRASGVPTIELRASIVIGSGSASYEAVRATMERLPLVVAPRWLRTLAQPIAIEDVLEYLLAAADLDDPLDAVIDIGGSDRVSYAEIMREYARQRGLRRAVVHTPLAIPRLSRWFLGIATRAHGRVAAAMVDSLRNETTVQATNADALLGLRPRGLTEAIERALVDEDRIYAAVRWSEALPHQQDPWGGVAFGHRRVFTKSLYVDCEPSRAFAPIQRIGGRTGWYGGDRFWRVRGLLDVARGGVGLRRGRRDTMDLRVGDAVDFWRVEEFQPNRLLRLRAEMKLPGRLWLQFELDQRDGSSAVRQTTVFDPAGFLGVAYWYALYPVHRRVFAGLLDGIRSAMGAGENAS